MQNHASVSSKASQAAQHRQNAAQTRAWQKASYHAAGKQRVQAEYGGSIYQCDSHTRHKTKGCKKARGKSSNKMEALPVGTTVLEPKDATNVRALAARGNDLAQDRPDIAFACQEMCREFAVPNARSFEKLKRVGRYCIKAPRMIYKYDWQACTDNVLDV